jgi:hypothetical protein
MDFRIVIPVLRPHHPHGATFATHIAKTVPVAPLATKTLNLLDIS